VDRAATLSNKNVWGILGISPLGKFFVLCFPTRRGILLDSHFFATCGPDLSQDYAVVGFTNELLSDTFTYAPLTPQDYDEFDLPRLPESQSKVIIKQVGSQQFKPIRFPLALPLSGKLDSICSLHGKGLLDEDTDQLLSSGGPRFRLWLTALRGFDTQQLHNCLVSDYLRRMSYYSNADNISPSGHAWVAPYTLPADTPGDMVLNKLRARRAFNLECYCASINVELPRHALASSSSREEALFTGPEPCIWESIQFPHPTSPIINTRTPPSTTATAPATAAPEPAQPQPQLPANPPTINLVEEDNRKRPATTTTPFASSIPDRTDPSATTPRQSNAFVPPPTTDAADNNRKRPAASITPQQTSTSTNSNPVTTQPNTYNPYTATPFAGSNTIQTDPSAATPQQPNDRVNPSTADAVLPFYQQPNSHAETTQHHHPPQTTNYPSYDEYPAPSPTFHTHAASRPPVGFTSPLQTNTTPNSSDPHFTTPFQYPQRLITSPAQPTLHASPAPHNFHHPGQTTTHAAALPQLATNPSIPNSLPFSPQPALAGQHAHTSLPATAAAAPRDQTAMFSPPAAEFQLPSYQPTRQPNPIQQQPPPLQQAFGQTAPSPLHTFQSPTTVHPPAPPQPFTPNPYLHQYQPSANTMMPDPLPPRTTALRVFLVQALQDPNTGSFHITHPQIRPDIINIAERPTNFLCARLRDQIAQFNRARNDNSRDYLARATSFPFLSNVCIIALVQCSWSSYRNFAHQEASGILSVLNFLGPPDTEANRSALERIMREHQNQHNYDLVNPTPSANRARNSRTFVGGRLRTCSDVIILWANLLSMIDFSLLDPQAHAPPLITHLITHLALLVSSSRFKAWLFVHEQDHPWICFTLTDFTDTIITAFSDLANSSTYHHLVASGDSIPVHEISNIIDRYNQIVHTIRNGMITNSIGSFGQQPQSWIATQRYTESQRNNPPSQHQNQHNQLPARRRQHDQDRSTRPRRDTDSEGSFRWIGGNESLRLPRLPGGIQLCADFVMAGRTCPTQGTSCSNGLHLHYSRMSAQQRDSVDRFLQNNRSIVLTHDAARAAPAPAPANAPAQAPAPQG